MIGIDTNQLVRIFASDNSAQAALAVRLLDGECETGEAFVNLIVLVEFAWTMRRAYRWNEEWIRTAIRQIVEHPSLTIQHRDAVLEAIGQADGAAGTFADRLIGAVNVAAGCRTTLTFDADAAKGEAFSLMPG